MMEGWTRQRINENREKGLIDSDRSRCYLVLHLGLSGIAIQHGPGVSTLEDFLMFARPVRKSKSAVTVATAILAYMLAATGYAQAQAETTLLSFGPSGPANPYSGLTIDAAGNMYGVTYYGQNVYQVTQSNGVW